MTSPQPAPQQSNTARDAAAVAALLEARLLAQAAVFGGALARTGSATAWQRLLHAQTDARLLVRRTLPLAAAAGRAQVYTAAHTAQREVIAHLRARQLPLTVLPLPSPLVNTHFGAPRVPAATDMIGLPSVEQIAQRLAGDIAMATRTVTRTQDAMYRDLVNAVIAKAMPSAAHRADAAQQILDQVADLGIVGLVDKAGRRWNLVTWMQMAARTAAQHAAVSARAQLLTANGQNTVLVSTQEHCCDKCAPYDGQLLAIGPSATPTLSTLAEAIAGGLLHPNCFPGHVRVSSPTGVAAGESRWYEGDLVVIHTASGNELPVTPNHPVLTPEGWVAAGALDVGDHVLRYDGDIESMSENSVIPDDQAVPARIGEICRALRRAVGVTAVRVPSAAEQFHGDGGHGDVDVVYANRLLRHRRVTATDDRSIERDLSVGDIEFEPLLSERPPTKLRFGPAIAAHRIMRGLDLLRTLVRRHLLPAQGIRRAPVAHGGDTGSTQVFDDGHAIAADLGGNRVGRQTFSVHTDEITDIEVRDFAGHVYNLETGGGWYVAESIVVHNCRCDIGPWTPGDPIPAPTPFDPKIAAQRAVRAEVHRQLRRAHRRRALALTPGAARKALALIRAWTARLRRD